MVFDQALGAVGDHHAKYWGQHILVGGTRVVVVFIEPCLKSRDIQIMPFFLVSNASRISSWQQIIMVFDQALGAVGDLKGDHHAKDWGKHILVGGTSVIVILIEPLLESRDIQIIGIFHHLLPEILGPLFMELLSLIAQVQLFASSHTLEFAPSKGCGQKPFDRMKQI
jgi:hypothetical protein